MCCVVNVNVNTDVASLVTVLSLALFTRNALFTNTRNISTTTVARTRTFAC